MSTKLSQRHEKSFSFDRSNHLREILCACIQERIEEWFVEYLREPGSDVGQVSFLFQGFAKRIWKLAADEEPGDFTSVGKQLQQSAEELVPLQEILLSKLHMWEDEAIVSRAEREVPLRTYLLVLKFLRIQDDEVVLSQHLWHTPAEMAVLRQRLRPNLTKRQDDVNAALLEVCSVIVRVLSLASSEFERCEN
eukprot:SAG31_NODE_3799_length_3870_cov_4.446036_4_plen_193_part_00